MLLSKLGWINPNEYPPWSKISLLQLQFCSSKKICKYSKNWKSSVHYVTHIPDDTSETPVSFGGGMIWYMPHWEQPSVQCVNRWVHSEEGLDDSYEPADRWHDGGHVLIPRERDGRHLMVRASDLPSITIFWGQKFQSHPLCSVY